MSQPHTPPEEPEQPPRPPQQGPYGYPHQPPAQPVADNPYAQAPPQQPGAYGYPQQPPNGGYGSSQPPTAGGFGYPQQQFPGPTGGGEPPRRRRGPVLVAAAVAVAIVAAVGGYVALAGGDDPAPKKPVAKQTEDAKPSPSASIDKGDGLGDGGDPDDDQDYNAKRKPGEAKVLFTVNAPDVPSGGASVPHGFTTSNGLVVKAAYKAVVGYDAKTGRKAWGTALPGGLCAVPREATADDRVVLSYGELKDNVNACDHLMQLDLRTGKVGWQKEVPEEGDFDSFLSSELTQSADVAVVTRDTAATAFSVADGKKLWVDKTEGECRFGGHAADRTSMVQVTTCGFDEARDQLRGVDPRTGKELWSSKKLPAGWKIDKVFSMNPLVVYSQHEEDKKWNIAVFDKGTVRSQVDLKDQIEPECAFTLSLRGLQSCTGVAARQDLIFLQTKPEDNRNAIVAVDTRTGKEARRAKSPEGRTMRPLEVQADGRLVVYVRPSADQGGMVGTLGADGVPRKLLQLPAATSAVERRLYNPEIGFDAGRVTLAPSRLNGNDEARELLMLVYGP
ncbi:PQQ-binding-like beta-propeller repeat protein [Streptomyces sp. NPDC060194]|uniref:outer membrane protein assembly factor BamB family protein n=1 Tax=Streptomyces sp. NPDC060194 TaxID=3347069 RepID=UPI003661C55B